jgi:hypothetical protein
VLDLLLELGFRVRVEAKIFSWLRLVLFLV